MAKRKLADRPPGRHTLHTATLDVTQGSSQLVGTFRTFGEYGPAYQVVGTVNGQKVHVIVLQTGEELDYPVEQAQRDPVTK